MDRDRGTLTTRTAEEEWRRKIRRGGNAKAAVDTTAAPGISPIPARD
jgi:hypothetical protein